MKQVELKTVSMNVMGNDQEFSYENMIQILMESPADPQKGANIGEVRSSMRVLDAIDKSNGTLELEDADFRYLFQRVQSARFTASNQVFVDFVDYFEEIEAE